MYVFSDSKILFHVNIADRCCHLPANMMLPVIRPIEKEKSVLQVFMDIHGELPIFNTDSLKCMARTDIADKNTIRYVDLSSKIGDLRNLGIKALNFKSTCISQQTLETERTCPASQNSKADAFKIMMQRNRLYPIAKHSRYWNNIYFIIKIVTFKKYLMKYAINSINNIILNRRMKQKW